MTKRPSRRTVLTNAAKTLAFSTFAATPLSMLSCKEDQTRKAASCNPGSNFNVVLHGLFFIELWNDHDAGGHPIGAPDQRIRIVAPDCSVLDIPHIYRAGSWSTARFRGFSRSKDYFSGWVPSPNENHKPAIALPSMQHFAGTLDYSQRYFSLYLPYPIAITPLRALDPTMVHHSGSISDAPFPLVVALTYEMGQRPTQPLMPNLGASWDANSNFHIFSEPECEMSCLDMVKHGNDTLMQAKKMFPHPGDYDVSLVSPIDCTQSVPPIKPDPCPAAPGVLSAEESSLAELFPCQHGDERKFRPAVHMPTCASVILTGP